MNEAEHLAETQRWLWYARVKGRDENCQQRAVTIAGTNYTSAAQYREKNTMIHCSALERDLLNTKRVRPIFVDDTAEIVVVTVYTYFSLMRSLYAY